MKQSALAVMLAFGLSSAHLEAASMGRINVLSALGQPLKAEVELSATPQELGQMKVRLAPPSVFKQAEIPYTRVLSSLRFTLDQKGDKPIIRINSDKPVHDPFLDFLIEITWPNGSMVREYTFLLDPPDNTAKNAALAAKFPEPKEFVNPPVTTASPPPVLKPLEEPKARTQMFVATDTASPSPAPVPTESPPLALTAPTIGPVVAEAPGTMIAPTAAPTSAPTAATQKKSDKPATSSKVEKPAKASKPAADGKTHAVQKGDTLGAIASEYLAADISLDQMLVSLFKANPSAFEGQNINRLKSGVILTIPDAETPAPSEAEAKKIIQAHTRDWHSYRQKLAASSEQRPAKPAPEASQTSQGTINTLKAEAPVPPHVANQDQLKVSRSEASGRKPGVSEEDLIAKDRALREAESRVAQLEKNIGELQKLLEMKNQNLAALQQQAGSKPAVPGAAPIQPIVQPIPEIAPGKDLLSKPLPPPLPADKVAAELNKEGAAVPATATASEQATTTPTEAPTDAPTPAPTPAPTLAPLEEEDPEPPTLLQKIMGLINAFGSNPIYYGSASAFLLALLGVIGWREHKRRKESARDEQFAALDPHEERGNAKTDANLGWQQPTAATQDAAGASSDNPEEDEITGDVDPVAEADVYIAYGREQQAEDLLKDALKSFPQRTAIHSRLLDIYTRREAVSEFEEIANLLFTLSGGRGEEWDKTVEQAAALGITHGIFAENAPMPLPNTEPAESAPAEKEIPEALDFEMPALEEVATEAPSANPPSFDYTSVDLNLGTEAPTDTASEPMANDAKESAPTPIPEEEPEEVTTKLDLAKAYIEMGDTDGARELLNEVLLEGGPTQQANAEKLLASLDQ